MVTRLQIEGNYLIITFIFEGKYKGLKVPIQADKTKIFFKKLENQVKIKKKEKK